MKKFYEKWEPEKYDELVLSDKMLEKNIAFKISGDKQFLHQIPEIRQTWLSHLQKNSSEGNLGFSIISGDEGSIAKTHPKISGFPDTAAFSSFNMSSAISYNKKQNLNAPVSSIDAFRYVSALNFLLNRDNKHRISIGSDLYMVFWAGAETKSNFPKKFGMANDFNPSKEDPDVYAKTKQFLSSLRDGTIKNSELSDDSDVPFYVLGLSPNKARIMVRYWLVSTIGEVGNNLGQHHSDMKMEMSHQNNFEYMPIWKILLETATRGDFKNINPKLGGEIIQSIITGQKYPESLLAQIIDRIRHDHKIDYYRAAIIKAILNRNHYRQNKNQKEVSVSLNKERTDIAYLLGRLFAILEQVQVKASGGSINATIKDRYFGAASATPSRVFPILLKLKNNHLKKLRQTAYFEILLGEIMGDIDDFPKSFSLQNQGLFNIGYYHQRNDFYKKKETIDVKNDETTKNQEDK